MRPSLSKREEGRRGEGRKGEESTVGAEAAMREIQRNLYSGTLQISSLTLVLFKKSLFLLGLRM